MPPKAIVIAVTSRRAGLNRATMNRLSFVAAALTLLLGLLPGAMAQAEEPGFSVSDARTTLTDGIYYLDARIDYTLSEPVAEALHNGVPIIIELEFQAVRDYWGLWQQPLAAHTQRYQLQYNALTRDYLYKNLDDGTQRQFATQAEALTALGDISAVPVLAQRFLAPEDEYHARLRARLDFQSLPTPLRLAAYLDYDWRLSSPWYTWPLQP